MAWKLEEDGPLYSVELIWVPGERLMTKVAAVDVVLVTKPPAMTPVTVFELPSELNETRRPARSSVP